MERGEGKGELKLVKRRRGKRGKANELESQRLTDRPSEKNQDRDDEECDLDG